MKIHKQGGKIIYEGKSNIVDFTAGGLSKNRDRDLFDYLEGVELTENLSASDKRRKLLTVELSQDEIMQCVDKLGYKIMPQWLATVFDFVEKVKVKLKGLLG